MGLLQQIDSDLASAMKSGDAQLTGVLRLLKSSLKNEQIKLGHELSDGEQVKLFQREAKQRKDSVEQYTKGDRADLAEAERSELAIIERYLPQQMSSEELESLVEEVIANLGATGLPQMGQVIGTVVKRAAGAADGGQISALVRQKLQ